MTVVEDLQKMELEEVEDLVADFCCSDIESVSDAKRALVGAGARVLFYPTLLYNVVRNKIQAEFRWWDQIGEFILLGAVPFPTDVPRLKELGVCGVITLNEAYETLVPTSLYHEYGIDHLVIPTRDYLFAPSYGDMCQAVDFIHKNASSGRKTYVHCKAGRGRSTTIVLSYLVQHKQMTPDTAYEYVRSIRSRVLLAPAQWQAVQEFYRIGLKSKLWECNHLHPDNDIPISTVGNSSSAFERILHVSLVRLDPSYLDNFLLKASPSSSPSTPLEITTSSPTTLVNISTSSPTTPEASTTSPPTTSVDITTSSPTTPLDITTFDDESSVVLVTESDLDGYDDCDIAVTEICSEDQLNLQTALAKLSCLGLGCHGQPQNITGENMSMESSYSLATDSLSLGGVDIHVY